MTEDGLAALNKYHVPVMVEEVLRFLEIQKSDLAVDVTLGAGGHSKFILDSLGKEGRLIGIDRDEDAICEAKKNIGADKRVEIVKGRMGNVVENLEKLKINSVDVMLADLGVSSFQFDNADRGFSFKGDVPLDMRMDRSQGQPLSELLQDLEEEQIADVIWKYGEERFSRRIARAIKNHEMVNTTGELAELVSRAYPPKKRYGRIHPATRTFQALRIMINDEMGELDRFLESAGDLLSENGRLVIISYHSLEDRKAKFAFRDFAKREGFEILTKRPVTASEAELSTNPRSRSAKLRAIKRVKKDAL